MRRSFSSAPWSRGAISTAHLIPLQLERPMIHHASPVSGDQTSPWALPPEYSVAISCCDDGNEAATEKRGERAYKYNAAHPPNARPARHRSQTLTLGGRPGALNRRKPVAGGRRDRAPTADRRGSSAEAPSGRRGKGGEPEPPTRAAEARIGEGSGGVRKVEVSEARCRATLRPHRRRRLRQRPRPRTRSTTTITAPHPPAGSCVTPSPAPPLVTLTLGLFFISGGGSGHLM
jgi:hypothetical protein